MNFLATPTVNVRSGGGYAINAFVCVDLRHAAEVFSRCSFPPAFGPACALGFSSEEEAGLVIRGRVVGVFDSGR